jgi:hypothetical protein
MSSWRLYQRVKSLSNPSTWLLARSVSSSVFAFLLPSRPQASVLTSPLATAFPRQPEHLRHGPETTPSEPGRLDDV